MTTTISSTTATTANLYPFMTKNQIKERLSADPTFRCQAMVILYTLQTAFEQSTESTLNRNRQGFMSSHAVHGSRVAKKIKAGEQLSSEDWDRVNTIAPRYSRQLACYLRAQAVADQPAHAGGADQEVEFGMVPNGDQQGILGTHPVGGRHRGQELFQGVQLQARVGLGLDGRRIDRAQGDFQISQLHAGFPIPGEGRELHPRCPAGREHPQQAKEGCQDKALPPWCRGVGRRDGRGVGIARHRGSIPLQGEGAGVGSDVTNV